MGNYEELKQSVADVIKSNDNQEITGAILQNALLTIISTVGNGATFAGIATPETNPGTPDQNVFYLATENGVYVNFGNIELKDEVLIFSNKNGDWANTKTGISNIEVTQKIESEISCISHDDTLNKRIKELYIDKSKYNFSSARIKYVAYQSSSDTYPISIELYQDKIAGIQKIAERAIPSSEFENNKVLELVEGVYIVCDIDKSDYNSLPLTELNSFVFNKPIKGLIAAYLYNKEYVRYVQTANYKQSLYNAAIKELLIWGEDVDLVKYIQYNKNGNTLYLLDYSYNILSRMEYQEREYICKMYPEKGDVYGLVIFDWDILEDADQYQTLALNINIAKDVESKNNLKQLYYAIKDVFGEYIGASVITLNVGKILNVPIFKGIIQPNTYYTLSINGDKSQISEFNINCTKKEGGYGKIGILPINGSITFSLDYEVTNILVQQTDITWDKTNVLTSILKYADESEMLKEVIKKIDNIPSADKLYHTIIGDFRYQNIINVGINKEYNNIQEAINSINDADINNQYLILIHDNMIAETINDLWYTDGTRANDYSEKKLSAFVYTKNYVNIMGANRDIEISVRLPWVSQNQIAYCHNVYNAGSVKMANLKIISENVRYCIHQENGSSSISGGDANSDKEYKNIHMYHYGNNNGISKKFDCAFGVGTAPNMRVYMENCTMIGKYNQGWNGTHSHSNYKYPFTWIMKNCIISNESGILESAYEDIYSGQKQTFIIEGCNMPMFGWKQGDYSFQYNIEDNAHDFRNGGIYLSGHSNCFIMKITIANVLFFKTKDNNENVSVIGGNAKKDIWGENLLSYNGTADCYGFVAGTELIYGSVFSLGKRLGNCVVENKVLEINENGTNKTITFDKDYTNINDNDIIEEINSKIENSVCGKSFEYEIPYFQDEVEYIKNVGNKTIQLGKFVTYDYINKGVKLSQNDEELCGISTTRINPGEWGYIIKRGKQKFESNIGGLNGDIIGKYYNSSEDGNLKETSKENAILYGAIDNVIEWVKWKN